MIQPSLPTLSNGLRVFSASLLSALMIMMPFVQLAAAANRRAVPVTSPTVREGSKAAAEDLFVNPLPVAGPITATKTDSYPSSPGSAAPGETITYAVDVTNTGGTDATGVQFTDTIDSYTTLVGGSLKVSPLAIADTYSAIKNTQLVVAAPGVLTNDTGLPAPTAVPIAGGATTQGGTVTLNADGSFTYDPPNATFTGADTFVYTATNSQAPPNPADAQGTVTINVDAAPDVASTTPTNGALDQATNTDITITFTEAVNVTGNWFQIVCTSSGIRNVADTVVTPNGSNTVFTINPNTDFTQAESCTVTVFAAQVTDQDSNDPPDNMTADYVFTFAMDAAPSVTATTPIDTATGVGTQSDITLTFSESVSLTAAPVTISCATSGAHNTYSVSASPNTAFTINPSVDFGPGELCTVTVLANQVSDTDTNDPPDNLVGNYVFSFTTDAPPAVTATTPTSGATNQVTNTDISITFDEAVNVTGNWFQIVCTSSGTRNVADTVVTPNGSNTVFTINPNVDFQAGETCTVTVFAAQVTDQDSGDPPDNMLGNHVFSFTMDAAPTVTANTPLHNATQVANNTDITITFSESVNLGATPVTISCATSGSHTSVISASPNTVFTVNPDTDFTNGELCTVTVVAAQVTDDDANDPPDNMAVDHVFSFTVDNPPSVTTTTPTNGATGVAASTNIVINFSEPVNATTASFQIECPAPGNTQAFTLSASPASSFTLDPVSNLPIGVICTVTVFAAQITDQDAGDPPDNMTADYDFSFSIPPDAVNDARSATGNIRIQTASGSGFSVLTNDIGPGITVTSFDATSVKGGNVSVAANGTFTYNPPPGYTGADTFNYTITNLAGSDTATVTINLSDMIWFIDDSATACTTISAATGCGRLTNPLSTMAAFEAVNGNADTPASNIYLPAAGDHIFIYSGSYTAPLTLENNQRVIGQGATSSLQTLSGVTPATDSDTLPSTTGLAGDRPSITSGGNGFNVVSNNRLYGLAFSNTAGTAINSNANVGTLILDFIAINNSSSNGAGIVLDDGGTSVTATGTNTINTRSGVGLSLTNSTTIGAGGLTFVSISVGNNDANADPANGIVLNGTGSSGGLTVTGNNTLTVGGDASGGTIRNTTSHGVSLTNTRDVSFTNLTIQTTGGSGVDGTTVTNFTFKNGTITGSGDAVFESNIAFNDDATGTENNVSGVLTVTNNILNTAFDGGLDVRNGNGTISDAVVTGNSITSTNSTATSKGSGIRLEFKGSAALVANLTKATITGNSVNKFPSSAGIKVLGGNANNAGPSATIGDPASAVNFINIATNSVSGESVAIKMGTNAIETAINGKGIGHIVINNNNPLQHVAGVGAALSAFGNVTVKGKITNNTIIANNTVNSSGIAAGADQTFGTTDTPNLTLEISGNNVSAAQGNGILTGIKNTNGTASIKVLNNTIAAPTAGSRPGIRADAGTNLGGNTTLCLEMSGNTTAGSGGFPGIGIREETTNTNTLNIVGLTPSPATQNQTEDYLGTQNPASVAGAVGFSFDGARSVKAIVLAGNGFSSCAPFVVKNGQPNATDSNRIELARASRIAEELPIAIVNQLFAHSHEAITDNGGATAKPAAQESAQIVAPSTNTSESIATSKTLPAAMNTSGVINQTLAANSGLRPEFRGHYLASANTRRTSEVSVPTTRLRSHHAKTQKGLDRSQKSGVTAHHATTATTEHRIQNAEVNRNHAATTRALAPVSGETVNHTIGTLPAGKAVRITFQVTVDSPFLGPNQVSNQGTVTHSLAGSPVVTDDPNTGTADDATVTPVLAPPDAVDDAYTAFKNIPLNVPAPGVLTNDTGSPTVSAVGGCADVTDPFTGCATTQGGTVTMNGDGSFTYTPPNATFTGADTFTYTATNGVGSDTATVTINVADTSAIYLNEVLFDPPSTDAPNEYIELRGPASATLPAGTYLVAIEGDAADNPGDVKTIINLSGLSFGSNGFLVLLQQSNTYVPAAGATVITSTSVGFGGLPGGIWSADASATDLPDSSVTFMLIQTGTAPTLTDDIDANDDGTADGVYTGWSVRDSIGALDGGAADVGYGALTYALGGGGIVTSPNTMAVVGFTAIYVGRICDSTGSASTDWAATGALGGLAPNWTLGSNPEPPSFAGNPLDHIGTTNFVNNAPVNTVPGAQATNEDTVLTFSSGGGNQISIADSDAGTNNVQVDISVTNGTLTLNGTTGLSFSFSDGNGTGSGDGVADASMIFRGSITDINTALNGMTFTPTSNFSGGANLLMTTNDLGSTGGAACSSAQTDTDSVSITVNGANDAPVLDNTGDMTLNPIPQDISAASNTGTLVSDIIASAGGDRITDVDAGAVEGLAVNAVDNSNGTWEFSTNNGGIWTAFGSPTDSTARLLAADANTRIRFQPNVGFSGTRTITFRAWDQTSGTNGGTGDASVNGGATAFSTATETASITVSSNINIQDAKVAEPSSGTIDMVFTVSLAAPAPGAITVNFTTQDEPAGVGKAVAGICGSGGDYTATNGQVSFAAGEQVKTINVPVCSDNTSEPDETFLVVLSGASGATIADGTATGTITAANPAGTLLISELRTSGPSGAGDDFVEIYNNTDSVHTVPAGGYGLFKMGADCNATPVLIGTIPAGTNIPARGHYLFVGSAYSLANYGGTNAAAGNLALSSDIENDRNVALFSTTDVAAISSVNRFDAVGFGLNTGGVCDLLREGSTLPAMAGSTLQYSFFRKMCDWIQGQGCTVPGVPKDTNVNADDFWLADTTGSAITGRLGAPGPERAPGPAPGGGPSLDGSPIRRDNAGINMVVLDGTVGSAAAPNRVRNGTAEPNATFGTMTLRYRVTNNTGANVTRLRYRVVDISTAIQPPGPTADLRALTSSIEPSVGPVGDSVTCTAGGAGAPPCTVTVQATTLETPPAQGIGGGYNSTLSSGTITTITPLGNGNSILINFKLGVEKTGTFRFYIIIEALP